MIPESDPPESLYKKEEIQMKLDKVEILEKEVNDLKNKYQQLRIRLSSHLNRLDIHEGRKVE